MAPCYNAHSLCKFAAARRQAAPAQPARTVVVYAQQPARPNLRAPPRPGPPSGPRPPSQPSRGGQGRGPGGNGRPNGPPNPGRQTGQGPGRGGGRGGFGGRGPSFGGRGPSSGGRGRGGRSQPPANAASDLVINEMIPIYAGEKGTLVRLQILFGSSALHTSVQDEEWTPPWIPEMCRKLFGLPLLNHDYFQRKAREVRVLDRAKEGLGVMPLEAALDRAYADGDDVILLNPSAEPPLVRICSVSKFRFEQDKAKKAAQKKQRETQQDLKELKLTPRTDVHDLQVRIKKAQKELSKGNKVKLLVQFKGREISSMIPIAQDLLGQICDACAESGSKEAEPRVQGRAMIMFLNPISKT